MNIKIGEGTKERCREPASGISLNLLYYLLKTDNAPSADFKCPFPVDGVIKAFHFITFVNS